MKRTLSMLWIFATLNYLYCDVVTLMDTDKLHGFFAGRVGGMDITQGFLLGAAVLVEIPIAMVLLSRVLADRESRIANIIAGVTMTVVQLGTVLVGSAAPYYAFFSAVEIAATGTITWYAWSWRPTTAVASHDRSRPAE